MPESCSLFILGQMSQDSAYQLESIHRFSPTRGSHVVFGEFRPRRFDHHQHSLKSGEDSCSHSGFSANNQTSWL